LLRVEVDDRALPDCSYTRRLSGRDELGLAPVGLFNVAEAGDGAAGGVLVGGGPCEEGRVGCTPLPPFPVGFTADGGT
jgi:hypothetical protein